MTRKRLRRLSLWSILSAAVFAAAANGPGRHPSLFLTSDRCISCHNGIVTSRAEDISFGTSWRPSMMANSARDPYWQAGVRRETLVHPTARAAIENECAACHMSMARFEAKTAGRLGEVFANLPAAGPAGPLSLLAMDGASCSMCHQIQETNFGQRSSFVAGFVVDPLTALGERRVFGPYEVDAGRQSVMRSSARFIPTEAAHIRKPELCATCHTLFTEALDANGKVIGELPEQVPYLEWKHSSYQASRSCQSCHMPVVDMDVPITGVLGKPKSGVSRHVFLAGNFFLPRVFNTLRLDLGMPALPQDLDNAIHRTVEHLETAAARVAVESLEIREGQLEARVRVENLAGHKLPSAYPSRRAWIRFTVRDRFGALLFESGRLNPDGSIPGNDNDASPDLYEPHYEVIDKPDQVQIYESVMAGPDDKVTTVLLTAVRYLKDNRLLPHGFLKDTADEDIAVRGGAAKDGNFDDGGDRVTYSVNLGGASGPFEVRAELWYQPIGYRWAHNLEQQETFESRRFVASYNALADQSAVVLAKASVSVPAPR